MKYINCTLLKGTKGQKNLKKEKRDVTIFTNRYDCKIKQEFRFESENDEISFINFQTSNNYHLGFIGFQLVLKSGKKTEWFGSQNEKEV